MPLLVDNHWGRAFINIFCHWKIQSEAFALIQSFEFGKEKEKIPTKEEHVLACVEQISGMGKGSEREGLAN